MARVSISKAAQLAGISRTAIYKTYIEKGLISISKDTKGKKYIDTSELLRVFGELQVDSQGLQVDTSKVDRGLQQSTPVDTSFAEVITLKSELEQLKQQLAKSEEREAWYQSQINTLTDTMKLLEGPKQQRPWWQFWK